MKKNDALKFMTAAEEEHQRGTQVLHFSQKKIHQFFAYRKRK